MRVGLEGREDKIQTLVASLESVWAGMLGAIEVALAAGLWKGQCAKGQSQSCSLPRAVGLWGVGTIAQLVPASAQGADRDERREIVTKVSHRERVTQVTTFFHFTSYIKNSLPTPRL